MMLTKMKSEYLGWVILVGLSILVLEFLFFDNGIVFSLVIPIVMMYYGWKSMTKSSGKLFFWLGLIFLILNVFSMMTFKFFVLAILIHFIIQFAQSKGKPEIIQPHIKEKLAKEELLFEKKPIFKNHLFGEKRTPDHVYEWNDVNIQTAVGDTVIDLTNTVLPKGDTVIFIRNIIGNIEILIPYDIEVCVNHSSLAGSTRIFHIEGEGLINQAAHFQTEGYESAEQRVKILTSLIIGDLEVKRA